VAEFIIGNSLRKQARKYPALRAALWRIDYALVWLLWKVSQLLPVDLSSRFGQRMGRIIGPRLSGKTAIYRANLATAFPHLDDEALDRLVSDAWGQAGRVLTEYSHLEDVLKEPERLQISILEPIETYNNPSKPCVVVTAHQSNWEVVGSAMAKIGIPNASLYSPPSNPHLNHLLLQSRQALNCQLLPRDNSARALVRALKEGRTAAMVMDRRVDEGSPVEFFGRAKMSTLMPAKLALKFICDMVPAQVERLEDARFRVTFHPPVRPLNDGDDESAQAIDMIQQVHKQFETWIRQNPQDWFCTKRLWPKGNKNPNKEDGDDAEVNSYAA
jgi:KDO2-lipid IV(A) lauroyltransferase